MLTRSSSRNGEIFRLDLTFGVKVFDTGSSEAAGTGIKAGFSTGGTVAGFCIGFEIGFGAFLVPAVLAFLLG